MGFENPKRILVVEDEEVMRRLLAQGLRDAGFTVLEGANGLEGLDIASNEHPDLIVLDINMPKMDGMTLMQKIRERGDWGKAVPIFVLTNLSANNTIMSGVVENEPSYYLMKTEFQIDDLIRKIKEELKITPQQATAE